MRWLIIALLLYAAPALANGEGGCTTPEQKVQEIAEKNPGWGPISVINGDIVAPFWEFLRQKYGAPESDVHEIVVFGHPMNALVYLTGYRDGCLIGASPPLPKRDILTFLERLDGGTS